MVACYSGVRSFFQMFLLVFLSVFFCFFLWGVLVAGSEAKIVRNESVLPPPHHIPTLAPPTIALPCYSSHPPFALLLAGGGVREADAVAGEVG